MAKEKENNLSEIIIIVISIMIVLGIGIYLFFGEKIIFYLQTQTDVFEGPSARTEEEVLTIAFAYSHDRHDPIYFDPVTRSHLADIYEGLVKTDKDLNVKPAIALTWGLIDPYTWEFILRKDVKFHNGQFLKVNDVIASINRAKSDQSSQLKSLLITIESVERIDDQTVRIKTTVPDPLLLQKLAVTLIFPADYVDFENPMGTGPYMFVSHEDNDMKLKRFDDYWGALPAFNNVILRMIEDKKERVAALQNGEVDLLINFPPSVGCSFSDDYANFKGCTSISDENLEVKTIPGLEVSFLAYNMENELFSNINFRKAISKALDSSIFVDIAFGFAVPSDQFVSSGVFGFNPDIEKIDYDLELAKVEINSMINSTFERISVSFAYPEELKPIGAYVKAQFRELGIDVDLMPLGSADLQRAVIAGNADFYFLGWRSELGDSSDFMQSVAHTQDLERGYGLFNGMNYSNEEVDELIELAQQNMNTQARSAQLREVMRIIVEDDVVGIPLYESELLYGVSKNIEFYPRIDGYVYPSGIK